MIHPLPQFPPLFPPGKWWRIFLSYLLQGETEAESIRKANEDSGLRARDWMRLRLKDDTLISFPVAGGASALKNRPPESWRMARECNRETVRYASTLATLYGRQPYFHLLADTLKPEAEVGDAAGEVCTLCHREICKIILPAGQNLTSDLRKALEADGDRIKTLSDHFSSHFNPDLSIIDVLMRLGPDAIFALLPAFKTL